MPGGGPVVELGRGQRWPWFASTDGDIGHPGEREWGGAHSQEWLCYQRRFVLVGPVVELGRGQRWGCSWFASTDGHIVHRGEGERRGVHSQE